jgi:hypothetical protein
MKTTNIREERDSAKKQAEEGNKYETLALSIDSGGAEHLMSTLTNLYSAPTEAVFREYVSNALDSHLKAKEKTAIIVGVHPSSTISHKYGTPYILTIQDFGVGMDKDDVVNVYSKYAASTKRDSNEQIGAFGLGAKSALAIANRFDVTSVKNGVELVFFIQKNDRGVGVIHFVSEKKTKERNGVTITIPVTNDSTIKIAELVKAGFFVTWDSSSYILEGELSKHNKGYSVYNPDSYFAIYTAGQIAGWVRKQPLGDSAGSGVGYMNPNHLPSFSIGGILYKMSNDSSMSKNWSEKYSIIKTAMTLQRPGVPAVIIDLPIGSVDLTPNREALAYTPKTLKAIEFSLENMSELLPNVVQEYLDTLELKDAVAYFYQNSTYFDGEVFTPHHRGSVKKLPTGQYRGEEIPLTHNLTSSITVLETETLSKFKKHRYASYIDVAAAVRKARPVHINHYAYGRPQDVTHVFVYGKTQEADTDKDLEFIKRNIRSYSQWVTDNRDRRDVLFYYDPEMETEESTKWTKPFVAYVHIDELGKKAKEMRSIISKEMREVREPKPKNIHYGLYIDADGKYKARKVNTDDMKNAKNVVIVSQNYRQMFYSGYELKYAWDALIAKYEETKPEESGKEYIENYKLNPYNYLFDPLSRIFPDTLIVFRMSKRSIAPLKKASPHAVELEDVMLQWFENLKAKDKSTYKHVLKIASIKPDRFLNTNTSISWILGSGVIDEITNQETKAVFQSFRKTSESYTDYLFLTRFFCQDTDNEARATKLGKIFNSQWSDYFDLLKLQGEKTPEMKKYIATLIDTISVEADKVV